MEENAGEKRTVGLLNDIELWSRSLRSRGGERRGEERRVNAVQRNRGGKGRGLLAAAQSQAHSCCSRVLR